MTAPGADGSAGDWWGTQDVCVQFGDILALDRVSFRADAESLPAYARCLRSATNRR